MKFLVIGKPFSKNHGYSSSNEKVSTHVNSLKSVVGSSTVEKAYALISGGFALVINANDTEELAVIVRSNPFFKTSHVDIIPIADAVDFVEGHAKYV
jgi:hypothetical protein